MEEIWKNINDFNDYQISSLGRVKSFKYGKEKVLKFKERYTGHFLVDLYKNGKSKTKRIHILVYETFNNYKLKDDDNIHHKDKSKKMILKKNSKLKGGEVWLIKKILNSDYYKSGKINYKYIGKMFNISSAEISRIKNGKRWNQVKYENS